MKRALLLTLCLAFVLAALVPVALADDKPRIAILEFENKADNQYWWHGGAEAMRDVFVTELVKSGKFRVIDRERLDALMREKNMSLSGDISAETAIRAGRLLGVEYFLTGAVTEYGRTDTGGHGFGVGLTKKKFVAAANARVIDAETGEILWADEARDDKSSFSGSIRGIGGGQDDQRMFDKVMKPIIQQLAASLKAADL